MKTLIIVWSVILAVVLFGICSAKAQSFESALAQAEGMIGVSSCIAISKKMPIDQKDFRIVCDSVTGQKSFEKIDKALNDLANVTITEKEVKIADALERLYNVLVVRDKGRFRQAVLDLQKAKAS